MGSMARLFLPLLIGLLGLRTSDSMVKFTNFVCTPLDKDYVYFPKCKLTAFNRTENAVQMRATLLKLPINNVTLNIDLRKRANGYKPFLYNLTFDACRFFRERRNPILNVIFDFIADFTNMNHTCPYDHDLIIENFPSSHLEKFLIKRLPVPKGSYALFSTWYTYNEPRATINFFASIS